MDSHHGGGRDDTVYLVRNVLALLVSSALMTGYGLPVALMEYDSGLAALGGTLALLVGLVLAVAVTLELLDTLERVAASLVSAWRDRRAG